MIFSSLFAKGVLGVAAAGSLVAGAQGIKHDDVKKMPVERQKVEIVINSNHALVRGATVTAVSGSTITATSMVGSTTLVWTVNVGSSTQVIASTTNSLASVAVGDTISFSGALRAGATTLTVDAKVVKDASKPYATVLKKEKKTDDDKHRGGASR